MLISFLTHRTIPFKREWFIGGNNVLNIRKERLQKSITVCKLDLYSNLKVYIFYSLISAFHENISSYHSLQGFYSYSLITEPCKFLIKLDRFIVFSNYFITSHVNKPFNGVLTSFRKKNYPYVRLTLYWKKKSHKKFTM